MDKRVVSVSLVEVYVFLSESSARTEMKISLPENLVAELDGVAMREKRSRNELISQAVRAYVSERTTRHNRDLMRRGYMEMAKINLVYDRFDDEPQRFI